MVVTVVSNSAKTPIGSSLMMPVVSAIIALKSASTRLVIFSRGLSGRVVMAAPKTMQKKMTISISPADAALEEILDGTMVLIRSSMELGVASSGAGAPVSVTGYPRPGLIRLNRSRPVSAARRLDTR